MLVIISDLHLTDGSSGSSIAPGAFSIFAERLLDLAVAASWRADGTYRPVESIDLLLLGDILDVIRSSRWLASDVIRPWGNFARPEFADLVTQITGEILRQNEDALAILRNLATAEPLTVPPATRQGRPALDGQPQVVPLRVHYLVGNHDWFLHLRGPRFDQLRRLVIERLGLVNRADEPFPHDPAESDAVLDALRRHRVLARHGDLYDPFNFNGDRDGSSLGDAIVIELINRFADTVQRELASELPASTIWGLTELDNVRPNLLVPVWLDGLLERTCPLPAQRRRVKQVWDQLADRFLALPFVRQQDTWRPNDLVDGLQKALKFSQALSLRATSSVIAWLNGLRGSQDESYYQHALSERDFRNRRAKHIVYGHTHASELVPLDASYAEGYVLNQAYFNSGTWRRVHRQTRFAPREHEFIASDVMTYLAFFQGDERGGRSYETWTGNLASQPSEAPIRRVDAGAAEHAVSQPVSSPVVHRHAPHFASPGRRSPVVPTRRQ